MEAGEWRPSRLDRFVAWMARQGAEMVVLSLGAGLLVEWWFDRGEGFSPLLFVLGILGMWGAAGLAVPWLRAHPPKPSRSDWHNWG